MQEIVCGVYGWQWLVGGRGSGGGLGVCMFHPQIHVNVPIYKKEILLSRNQGVQEVGWWG